MYRNRRCFPHSPNYRFHFSSSEQSGLRSKKAATLRHENEKLSNNLSITISVFHQQLHALTKLKTRCSITDTMNFLDHDDFQKRLQYSKTFHLDDDKTNFYSETQNIEYFIFPKFPICLRKTLRILFILHQDQLQNPLDAFSKVQKSLAFHVNRWVFKVFSILCNKKRNLTSFQTFGKISSENMFIRLEMFDQMLDNFIHFQSIEIDWVQPINLTFLNSSGFVFYELIEF